MKRNRRRGRILAVAALLCVAIGINATEIEIKANKTVRKGTLRDGAMLHGNRSYAYAKLPKTVQGLEYTLHDHKSTANLSVKVKNGGTIYLLLVGSLRTSKVSSGLQWKKVGGATCAGNEKVTIYSTDVKPGQALTFKAADKWGTIFAVKRIGGLSVHKSTSVNKKPTRKPAANFGPGEFGVLKRQIAESKSWNNKRLAKEALRQESLILESDKTPVDIVLRRTAALMSHLKGAPNGPALDVEAKELAALQTENKPGLSDEALKKLFSRATKLRRRIAFQNPLLDFNKIVFLKHNGVGRHSHMVDQYLGFNQTKGGGLYVLDNPFSDKAKVRSLLGDVKVTNGRLKGKTLEDNGSFISLELDWEAKTVYFAFTEAVATKVPKEKRVMNGLLEQMKNVSGNHYYWDVDRVYHIFKGEIAKDGKVSNLRQITFGKFNDFDPCVLPNGRLVFISGRIGGNQRCGSRMCSTYTLHSMMNDGSDIITFSYHDTNEWHPSVDNNGMIIYTRWDYVDRDSDIAHHIWHCFPDGRDPRSYHGNYPKSRESRPWMELAIRAIPNSRKYIAVSAPHHGENYGSLVQIDISKKDDASMSQVKRISPEVLLPESEMRPGVPFPKGRGNRAGQVFGTPWALSEDFYIAVYDAGGRRSNRHGVYLVDSFGNREMLYQDPKIACLDPIPLRPRKRPPIIPTRTVQAKADRQGGDDLSMGTVTVMNIYQGEYDWPKGTKIKEIRVVNVFPKPNLRINYPNIGHAAQSLARGVLGTVPVEEDGSAHFKVPTGASIYFQALDEKGMVVQNMKSATYLHPGETLSCIGCHEPKQDTPKNTGAPKALRRGPSTLKPGPSGSFPLTFPRLVQPVLDAKCVDCHAKEKKAPSLDGKKFTKSGWSEGFATLNKYAWGKSGGNGAIKRNGRSYSIPGQEGARVSKLYKHLAKGHHDVKLTDEEMLRITMWLDCNSNFFGAYYKPAEQAKGEIVKPLLGLPRNVEFEKLKK